MTSIDNYPGISNSRMLLHYSISIQSRVDSSSSSSSSSSMTTTARNGDDCVLHFSVDFHFRCTIFRHGFRIMLIGLVCFVILI